MNGKLSIIISVILVTAAILTVQSSMLQIAYAQSRLDANTQNTILNMHNQERNAVRVPQVTWSNSVATDAQAWADYIVSLNLRWDLCGTAQDPNFRQCPPHQQGVGENLAWGYNTPLTVLVQSWINEKSNYAPGTPIGGNLAGPNGVYGHYTQMVWSSTTQIGCGIAQQTIGANNWDILVCRYSPQGNIIGQVPYGQGAQAVTDEETTLGDQGAVQQDAGAPPADQAVVEEEVQESEVIQEVPPQ